MKSSLSLIQPKGICTLVVFVAIFSAHAFGTITGTGNNFNAVEGASFNGAVASFTDSSPDLPSDVSATINWGDGTLSAGIVSQPGAGMFAVIGNHTYAEEGNSTVTVTLHRIPDNSDNSDHVATPSTATVKDAPLTAGASSPGNCTEGAVCNLTVAAFTDADPNGVVSDYTATITWGDGTSSSPGTIVANGTGGFNVSGSHVYAEEGSYTVSTRVADSGGSAVTANISMTVADALLSALGTSPANCTEGAVCNLTVATFTDADPSGTLSDYAATINWGDGTSLSPGTIAANMSGGFNVIGSHVYAEEGSYTVGTHVADTGGSTANMSISVSVTDAALSASGTTVNATEGTLVSNTVMATFTDADPNGVVSDYTAIINWGDGTPSSSGTIVANGTGGFNVVGSHVYAEEGNYTAKITVMDVGGAKASANTSVSVADAPLSVQGQSIGATEGTLISNVLMATFSDSDPNAIVSDYTAIINWGDGTSSAAVVSANGGGGFNVIGSHAYADEGPYTAQITVTDIGGSVGGANTNVNVLDAPLSASGTTINATEGALLSNAVMAIFTDANPNGVAGDFTATINWGDGTLSAAVVSTNGTGGFNVSGNHVYADEGTYNAQITVTDDGGSSVIANTTVSVADASLSASGTTVAAPHGASFTAVMATFTDANPNGVVGNFTALINWGDGSSSAGTVSANASGGFNVLGTHTYIATGGHTATITIHDVGGSMTTATSNVKDDFPLTATGRRLHVRLGAPFSLVVASFTDADPSPSIGNFTASIDWGDGTAPTLGIITKSGPVFNVSGNHAYKKVGGWNVTVTILDTGGATATATSTARLFPRAFSY
ncbi:MAG TPA: hypothetical protein VK738_10845 [Terriglobales bacterium]|nr:hypothetical protein [Terriglobales bacterium]